MNDTDENFNITPDTFVNDFISFYKFIFLEKLKPIETSGVA